MLNSELIDFLSSLNKKEFREFEKFVNSPFFTKGKKLPSLKLTSFYCLLKKYYPDFSNEGLTKENIYAKLYPGKIYNDNIFRNLCSRMLMLVKEYLRIKRFLSNEFECDFYLLIQMIERKQEKSSEKILKQIKSKQEKKYNNSEYFFNRFRLSDYESYYFSRKSFYKDKTVQETCDSLLRFYLLRMFPVYMLMVNNETISGHVYKKPFMNETLMFINNNMSMFNDVPEISIYYNLLLLFKTGNEKYFHMLIKLKNKYIKQLDTVEQNNIYVCLGNYCIKMIASGKKNFHRQRFKLDKEYLVSGLIDKKIYMKLPLYISIAMNALDSNEKKWVSTFIVKYTSRLAPEYREFAESYIEGEILFREKQFNEALKKISRLTINIAIYRQILRNLQLKIYIEFGYYDEAISLIESSRQFISKEHNIAPEIAADFYKFLSFAKKMINCKSSEDKKMLEKTLADAGGFRNKEWLLGKLKEK